MRQHVLLALALTFILALAGCGGGSSQPAAVTSPGPVGTPSPLPPAASFFALNINKLADPWPTQLGVTFGVWRSLGSSILWADLEPCQPADETNVNDPCYLWNVDTRLDTYINNAISNGQDVLYTAYYTPSWASPNPSDSCAGDEGPGGCWPPVDVESGDNHWKNFLTALFTHVSQMAVVNKRQPYIKYWECWNEPDITSEYAGSLGDLNTMCMDLYNTIHALDSTAQFTTPAPTTAIGNLQYGVTWMSKWLSQPAAANEQYIAFHGYCFLAQDVPCQAEAIPTSIVQPLQQTVASAGVSKPLWDTEVGYGPNPNADDLAAFVARLLLLQQSAGLYSVAFYGWDFGNGISLINNVGSESATLNLGGIAYQQIYNWTVGATYTSACQNTSGTIWQCQLSASGTNDLIVWDTSQTSLPCPNSACGTTSFTVPGGYTEFDDIAGNTNQTISGSTVSIGMKPIRLH